MSPVRAVRDRWWFIVIFTVVIAGIGYAISSGKPKRYKATALVQIVLSSQQTGSYVDPNTLDELTNVYLEVAQNATVYQSAARTGSATAEQLETHVTPSVTEPGVLAFTATTESAQSAAAYANAVSGAFSTGLASAARRTTQARVTALNARVTKLQQAIAQLPATSPLVASYTAELSAVEQQISDVLSTPGTVGEVIQPATVPAGSFAPTPARDAGILALFGLLLSPVLIYLYSLARDGYGSADEAANDLGLPLLTVVPKCTDGSSPAESIRLAHIAITLGRPRDTAPLVIVTSARSGEGKTFFLRGLLETMSADATPLLIVDADTHKGDLSAAAGLAGQRGLSEVLAAHEDAAPLLAGAEDREGKPGAVKVLAAGDGALPMAILGGQPLEDTMARIRETMLPVYIDTPPVLAASDALALSRYATDVVVVINGRRSRRREVREAVSRLRSVAAPVRGIIFNYATVRNSGAYGYGYAASAERAVYRPEREAIKGGVASDPLQSGDAHEA